MLCAAAALCAQAAEAEMASGSRNTRSAPAASLERRSDMGEPEGDGRLKMVQRANGGKMEPASPHPSSRPGSVYPPFTAVVRTINYRITSRRLSATVD